MQAKTETASSALLLSEMLAPRLASLLNFMPVILQTDQGVSSEVRVATMLFSPGCLLDMDFLRKLQSLLPFRVSSLPVIVDSFFAFPSRTQTIESCQALLGDDWGEQVADLIMTAFKEIACLFDPRTSSLELLDMHADAIAVRLRDPRHHKRRRESERSEESLTSYLGSRILPDGKRSSSRGQSSTSRGFASGKQSRSSKDGRKAGQYGSEASSPGGGSSPGSVRSNSPCPSEAEVAEARPSTQLRPSLGASTASAHLTRWHENGTT
eukprot:CAMPEP_0178467100 /NCGR_PEP_ID=MMETSP0689_2-20121128/52242_1 /TAXON_ID=160604 /ORGANISM="Amphidinium massartii, Strain CS-259" /LENGTH=266 /DNA_ID=CAMNT_0020094139 /DNA_START=142 /DNA_END=939 /DNA_ORIENTATION=+